MRCEYSRGFSTLSCPDKSEGITYAGPSFVGLKKIPEIFKSENLFPVPLLLCHWNTAVKVSSTYLSYISIWRWGCLPKFNCPALKLTIAVVVNTSSVLVVTLRKQQVPRGALLFNIDELNMTPYNSIDFHFPLYQDIFLLQNNLFLWVYQ